MDNSQIPKIIHYMWLDKESDFNNSYPNKFKIYVDTFYKYNPEYKFMFWNIDKIKNLLKNPDVAKYEKIWNDLKYHIQKCDFARYLIMYIYGGIYIDLNFKCFRNLTPL